MKKGMTHYEITIIQACRVWFENRPNWTSEEVIALFDEVRSASNELQPKWAVAIELAVRGVSGNRRMFYADLFYWVNMPE